MRAIKVDTLSYSELFDETMASKNVGNASKQNDSDPNFCVTWKNLSVTLRKKNTILIDNVSGVAQSGRVLALMGPSGAGKTTLLNALGNRVSYAAVQGSITYGNREFTTSDLYLVPQFDEFNASFTVYETIEIIGLLKCTDTEAMYTRLNRLLGILGLQKKAKTLCTELTGGELKRVSVGMGMVCNPSVLFLDEPTTGLDSSAAFSIVQHIVDVAESENVVVIMTIHQPSEMVFDLLQDLYLLERGTLAYAGPLACCEKYFDSIGYQCPDKTGLADFYLDLIYNPPPVKSGGETETWRDYFSNSTFGKNVERQIEVLGQASPVAASAPPPPSPLIRLFQMTKYLLTYYSRDQGLYLFRIICLIIIALFTGTMFLQLSPETNYITRYVGALFFSIWVVLFSATGSTGLIARDRKQFADQVVNAVVSPAVYCTSQFIASIPFNFVGGLVYQCIFHWMTNINPNGETFIYAILITCGHLLLMEGIMLCVVQGMHDPMLSVTFSMVMLGTLFLFPGFFIKTIDMPEWIRWITFIIPTRYSFDGYLYQIFHSQRFLVTGTANVYLSGDEVLLQLFGSREIKPWPMFVTLLAWIALIRLVHFGIFTFEIHGFGMFRSKAKKASKNDKLADKIPRQTVISKV